MTSTAAPTASEPWWKLYSDMITACVVLAVAVLIVAIPKARAALRKRRWDFFTWLSNCCPKHATLAVACLFVGLAFVGGLLNRVRGGWQPGGLCAKGGDLCARMMFSVPSGIVFAALGGGNLYLCASIILFNYLGIIEGWGCYFNMARGWPLKPGDHADCVGEPTRNGMFDWFLGKPDMDWTFFQAWSRDWNGMSMRGLVWTVALGILVSAAGFRKSKQRKVCYLDGEVAWAAGGILMGLVYELGHDIPCTLPNFSQGTPLAEFLWGAWLWTLYGAVVLGTRQGPVPPPAADEPAAAMTAELVPVTGIVVGDGPGVPLLQQQVENAASNPPPPSPAAGAMALARGILTAVEVLIGVVGVPTLIFTIWWAGHHP